MKHGKISNYTYEAGVGVINTESHERFVFTRVDWLSRDTRPEPGMAVSFDAAGMMALKVNLINSEQV